MFLCRRKTLKSLSKRAAVKSAKEVCLHTPRCLSSLRQRNNRAAALMMWASMQAEKWLIKGTNDEFRFLPQQCWKRVFPHIQRVCTNYTTFYYCKAENPSRANQQGGFNTLDQKTITPLSLKQKSLYLDKIHVATQTRRLSKIIKRSAEKTTSFKTVKKVCRIFLQKKKKRFYRTTVRGELDVALV